MLDQENIAVARPLGYHASSKRDYVPPKPHHRHTHRVNARGVSFSSEAMPARHDSAPTIGFWPEVKRRKNPSNPASLERAFRRTRGE